MSVRVLSKAMRESRAELGTRLVAFALADSAHDDGVTWVGQDLLAEKTLLSERQVRTALENLSVLEELQVVKVQRGRRRINVYRLRYPGLAEPDLDRMPAEVADALRPAVFAGRQDGPRPAVSDRDDRQFPTALARAQDDRSLNRKKNRNGPGANAPGSAAPKLTLVDGRNLALDAIAEACNIQQGSPRYRECVAAVNGSRAGPGIRSLYAAESLSAEPPGTTYVDLPQGGFERNLAAAIHDRAALWPLKMGDATLTPTALAKWWVDLPAMADRGKTDRAGNRAVTAADMERKIAEAGRRDALTSAEQPILKRGREES